MLSPRQFEVVLSGIKHFLSGFLSIVLVNNTIENANIGVKWIITLIAYLLLLSAIQKVFDFIQKN